LGSWPFFVFIEDRFGIVVHIATTLLIVFVAPTIAVGGSPGIIAVLLALIVFVFLSRRGLTRRRETQQLGHMIVPGRFGLRRNFQSQFASQSIPIRLIFFGWR
jgi:FtsH-binding integral membrane protein